MVHVLKRVVMWFLPLGWLYAAETSLHVPIRVGIVPHSSPRLLFESHVDVKLFLEGYFKRDVQISTAKSFHEFSKLTTAGTAYDLIITSSHLALLAQTQAAYQPFMSYTDGIEIAIVSREKDALSTSRRPLHVGAQGDVSLSTLLAEEWLASKGLREGSDVVYHYEISASDALAIQLTNGTVDMAVMSWPNYLSLDDTFKASTSVVYRSPALPYSRTFAAKEGNGISLKKWEEALRAFSLSAEGKKHLDTVKLGTFKWITVDDLRGLESPALKTYQRVNQTP